MTDADGVFVITLAFFSRGPTRFRAHRGRAIDALVTQWRACGQSEGDKSTRNRDNNSGTQEFIATAFERDKDADYGYSAFHAKQRGTISFIYELPFGKERHWLTEGPAAHSIEWCPQVELNMTRQPHA